MKPRIEILQDKKLIGFSLRMSIINNKTHQLWSRFVPEIKEIKNKVSADKISLQVYPPSYHQDFKPTNQFEKWATVEVKNFDAVPLGMDRFSLTGGKYAVFDYKGSGNDKHIFQYIFMNWLPNSIYQVDDRPHFEVLGEKYKNNDPTSEEEIWIPIRNK